MSKAAAAEEAPKTMREMIQKKFLEEIIGCSRKFLFNNSYHE
jgi:hypothetical protein